MKRLFTLIVLFTLSSKLYCQNYIPETKNLNPGDKYPERSILASYTTNFDILISLKAYSAWGPDDNIKILAHHRSGWYKIEINTDHKNFGTFDAVCYLMFKINDSTGNMVWNALKENHLFDMVDDRSEKLMNCGYRSDTIIVKGKKKINYTFCGRISDGSEYEFEIITRDIYKKIYFYTPFEKHSCCPELEEIKWIANCINVFEKHLGK